MAILTKFELTPKRKLVRSLLIPTAHHPCNTKLSGLYWRFFGLSQKPPKTVLLIEEWDSQKDFEAYLNWRVERGDFAPSHHCWPPINRNAL